MLPGFGVSPEFPFFSSLQGCAEGRSPLYRGDHGCFPTSNQGYPKRVQESSLPRVLGVSPNSSLSPMSGGQGVEKEP